MVCITAVFNSRLLVFQKANGFRVDDVQFIRFTLCMVLLRSSQGTLQSQILKIVSCGKIKILDPMLQTGKRKLNIMEILQKKNYYVHITQDFLLFREKKWLRLYACEKTGAFFGAIFQPKHLNMEQLLQEKHDIKSELNEYFLVTETGD